MKKAKHFLKLKGIFSLLILLFSVVTNNSYAQRNIKDTTIAFPMIGATVAFQMPGGDLSKRFGNNFAIGGVFQWKLRNNYIFGISGDFLFSDNVKENNLLDGFKTADGNIIDGNGHYASIILYERGLKFDIKGGKIFPLFGPNINSGLMTTFGIGYIQHKILIDTPGSSVPYLEGDYRKGYDRLSTGICLTQFAGYMNFGNKRLTNFYAGLEVTEAFTKNRRNINFDTGLKDDKSRIDLLLGIRFGWVFPMYKRMADKIYID